MNFWIFMFYSEGESLFIELASHIFVLSFILFFSFLFFDHISPFSCHFRSGRLWKSVSFWEMHQTGKQTGVRTPPSTPAEWVYLNNAASLKTEQIKMHLLLSLLAKWSQRWYLSDDSCYSCHAIHHFMYCLCLCRSTVRKPGGDLWGEREGRSRLSTKRHAKTGPRVYANLALWVWLHFFSNGGHCYTNTVLIIMYCKAFLLFSVLEKHKQKDWKELVTSDPNKETKAWSWGKWMQEEQLI